MDESPTRAPRRYATRELGDLDLAISDPRVVWATRASASSEWSDSYAASSACGPPAIFPAHGDHEGTWLAESSDQRPHLDVTFPSLPSARALIVCETCGPGSVVSARDLERDVALLSREQRVKNASGGAQLLVIPLESWTTPPRRVRLEQKPRSSDYQEIDAVGLITVPLDELIATPPALGPTRHARYAPSDVPIHDLRGDRRLRWAKRARASSEYSSGYAAKEATGRPNVFPKGGDHDKTWLADSSDRSAWLELEFDALEVCYGFVALETCGAGAIVRATDEGGAPLWEAKVEECPSRQARLLHVTLDPPRALSKLRLWVSPRVDDYREIDAVALLDTPFADLATEAPPPPPPPIPGAPAAGFLRLEGTLAGPSVDAPWAHGVLRTDTGAAVFARGGPATLRLADGRDVALDIGETCVYGRPLPRLSGRFDAVARQLPWLREALGERAPSDDAEVVLEGQQLTGGERAFVAAAPSRRPSPGGFREAAGVAERVSVAAIATRPLESTGFLKRGTASYLALAEPRIAHPVTPHPLERWLRGSVVFMGLAGLALGAALASARGQGDVSGGAALGVALTLMLTLAALVVSLEFTGRARTLCVVEGGPGRKRRERTRFTSPGWTLTGTIVIFVGLGIVYGAVAALVAGDGLEGVVRLALVGAGVHALLRLAMWQWADRATLRVGLPLLLTPSGRLEQGARGRFTGALERSHHTRESFTAHIEHLGTYESTDDQGQVTTHDRYREWTTRSASSDVRQGAGIYLPDGTLVRAGAVTRTVDPEVRARPASGKDYASFAAEHPAGSPATFVGVATQRDGEWLVDPCVVVLGGRRALRQETLVHLGALAGLVTLVVAGILAASL